MIRTAILSVLEDEGTGVDGGEAVVAAVREVLSTGPFVEIDYQAVPDEQARIRARLRLWADDNSADLVLTLGGAGVGLRQRTPEATLEVIERLFPGIPEAIRAAGAKSDPDAGLWRVVAGVRRNTVIVNLPAGAANARTSLAAVSHSLVRAAQVMASQKLEIGEVPSRDGSEVGRGRR